jgi:predicted DNA-binding protein
MEDKQIKQINFRIDDTLRDRLADYCAKTGLLQSVVFRRALEEYLTARELQARTLATEEARRVARKRRRLQKAAVAHA